MIAPASTGKDNKRRITVIKIDHTNRGICSKCMFLGRILKIVQMKLIAPIIEEIPARCNLKIAKSTEILL